MSTYLSSRFGIHPKARQVGRPESVRLPEGAVRVCTAGPGGTVFLQR